MEVLERMFGAPILPQPLLSTSSNSQTISIIRAASIDVMMDEEEIS